jgi:hypothetical protein
MEKNNYPMQSAAIQRKPHYNVTTMESQMKGVLYNSFFQIAYRNLETAILPKIAKMRICVFNYEFYNFAQNCIVANSQFLKP